MTCSSGQEQAIEQLTDIAEASDGDLEIVHIERPAEEHSLLYVRVSLSTRHLIRAESGFRLAGREGLRIAVPSGFPLDRPSIYFTHKRFAGFPHVQWGNSICLYQSSDLEWIAADGMFGFTDRLNEWMRAAALDQLDPDNVPLHPPAIYPSADVKIVAKADAPELVDGQDNWIGTAHFVKKNEYCLTLDDWSSLEQEIPDDLHCGAAILINQPLPMEYPDTVFNLIEELTKRSVRFSLFYSLLRLYALHVKDDEDMYVVVGAPMRRKEAGADLRQHLAVWRVPADSARDLRNTFGALSNLEDAEKSKSKFFEWAATAKTEWCRVFEDRPETTIRRDVDTASCLLHDKRILLLGCGALGSSIAQFIVRSGAKKLTLVDNGLVTPGILVRQIYDDRSIGFTKVSALKIRLDLIKTGTEIEDQCKNLRYGIFSEFSQTDYDLVIDTTASRTVSIVLEQELKKLADCPPIASMSVSARAKFGMVTVRMPSCVAGPLDISRRTKIATLHEPTSAHFGKAFWPTADEIELFQPEPGCSEPTFIGSAADMAFHSSNLLNLALERLKTLSQTQSSADFTTLSPRYSAIDVDRRASFIFDDVCAYQELRIDYEVIVSPEAKKLIDSEITRNCRTRSAMDETGGLLFGAIDDSLERIYIDMASGPPPDSKMTPKLFECGVEGTAEAAEYHKTVSRGSSIFTGIWHTHPISPPRPSEVDLEAMVNILHFQDRKPRHVVMLIIGYAASRPIWNFYLFRRRDFKIIENL